MMIRWFLCGRLFPLLVLAAVVVGFPTLPSAAFADCGDTVIDAGEDCDDGNVLDGDCCSAACLYESVGSPCADDGEFCTRDQCDGAGICGHDAAPRSCLVTPKGRLQIVNDADDAKDKLSLQLENAPGVAPEDFGDPVTSDTYHVCVFGPDGLLMEAEVDPGGTCDKKPCWDTTPSGFAYKDSKGTRDGITELSLRASPKPKTKITVHGKGGLLAQPEMPFPDALMAQIVNEETGLCVESYFLEPSAVKKNTNEEYAAKAGLPGLVIPGLPTVILHTNATGSQLNAGVRQDDVASPASLETPAVPDGGPRAGPDPAQVHVQSITYAGSGCPPGTLGQTFSEDRTTFTLSFDQYVASKGPGVPISQERQSCRVELDLRIPQGWQYSIATIEYHGHVSLPKKMKARQQSTYSFAGHGAPVSADTRFVGPVDRDYRIRDTLPFSTVVWSSCDEARPLTISTELELTGGSEPGTITADGVDGRVNFVAGLRWKPC